MKKILLAMSCVVFTTALYFGTVNASFTVTGETITETTLTQGVILKEINRTTTAGPLKMKLFQVQIDNPDLTVNMISDASCQYTKKDTKAHANAAGAIAAINGTLDDDQLVDSAGHSVSRQMMIKSGKLRTAKDVSEPFSFFTISDTKVPNIREFTSTITVTSPFTTTGASQFNKFSNPNTDKYNDLTILTQDFRNSSIGNLYNDMVEIVVNNFGKVSDIRINKPAVTIPTNGFVLVTRQGGNKQSFINNLSVGDAVSYSVTSVPGYASMYMGAYGDATIVNNGNVVGSYDTGKSPGAYNRDARTAIGYRENQLKVYLATVDEVNSVGMTYEEMGEFMNEQGCYEAINLDGGGSTMAVAKIGGTMQVLNNPSDGSPRPVVNAIGIFKN